MGRLFENMPAATLLAWTNEVRIWGAGLAVLAAAVTLISSFLQIRLQAEVSRQKDAALAKYQADAGIQIADAGARAAEANERAAALENEAAAAKLELEKLRALTAYRRITREQRTSLLRELAGPPIDLVVRWPATDPEAALFADDIGTLLNDAGFRVAAEPMVTAESLRGMAISFTPSDPAAQADWIRVAKAFQSVGLTFGQEGAARIITITVGHKKINRDK